MFTESPYQQDIFFGTDKINSILKYENIFKCRRSSPALAYSWGSYGKCPWIIVDNARYGSCDGQPSCALLINGEMFLVSDEILVSDRYRTGSILSAHLSVQCLADPNVSDRPHLLQEIHFAVWLSREFWRLGWQILTDRRIDFPEVALHVRAHAQGCTVFSKEVGNVSKFYAPKGWHEGIYKLRAHKYQAPAYKIYAPLLLLLPRYLRVTNTGLKARNPDDHFLPHSFPTLHELITPHRLVPQPVSEHRLI